MKGGDMTGEQWTIQEVVRSSGVTSRTLRHYEQVGILLPTGTGAGGVRLYDEDALVRLQRILVLRELGVGLREIGDVLDAGVDAVEALRAHVEKLESERARLAAVVESVRSTIKALEKGEQLVADTMFNGFDHTQYKDEVVDRWGEEAYTASDTWWRSLDGAGRKAFEDESSSLIKGFADASARGLDVHGSEVQALARRQYEWIRASWGGTAPSAEACTGLGQMYVDDPRFGKTYSVDGREFAAFVRDAMVAFAEKEL